MLVMKSRSLRSDIEYGRNDLTQTAEGIIPIDAVKNFEPDGHSRRGWKIFNGAKYFGLYREDKWRTFLEDIKSNGVKNAIMIYVEKDGKILIGEGSHRIEACLQTDVKEIPVDIRYFGGSELYVKNFDEFKEEEI